MQLDVRNSDSGYIWRHQHLDRSKYALHGIRGHPPRHVYCMLDMTLVSFSLVNNVIERNIKPGFLSDHSVPLIDLNLVQCE